MEALPQYFAEAFGDGVWKRRPPLDKSLAPRRS